MTFEKEELFDNELSFCNGGKLLVVNCFSDQLLIEFDDLIFKFKEIKVELYDCSCVYFVHQSFMNIS